MIPTHPAPKRTPGYRRLKADLRQLLTRCDPGTVAEEIAAFPPRKAVNPLLSFLHRGDELLKWRSVRALGMVVANLADDDMESARVLMRRLMWSLNDESGGIGWGSAEAMGEIMARHERLAAEYACILVSYIRPAGNFLEHAPLQRGVLWGLGRLAHARPELVRDALPQLTPFLAADDGMLRALAAWALGAIGDRRAGRLLAPLRADPTTVTLFRAARFVTVTVGHLAARAHDRVLGREPPDDDSR